MLNENAVIDPSRFGFTGFRAGQRELIDAVLAGHDALGILPTGGGKSLTYQLPATILGGLTVVVSPLIALMKDQVDAFNRRGLGKAVAVHSNLTPEKSGQALGEIARGQASLLYIAPERLEFQGWQTRIAGMKPKLFVIDEAHCVSQWGYDFRPSYLALRDLTERLRPCPVLALTATATPPTRRDIVDRLGLRDARIVVAPFDRPNLRFEVEACKRSEKPRLLRRLLKQLGPGSKIIYVGRRKDADHIAAELTKKGYPAVAYHAGRRPEARHAAQEAWLRGDKPVTVATIAFGMGIDKPDVRAVIHYQHPSSLEAYYQEAGRAGRDGDPARCIVMFSGQDVALASYFIKNRYPTREQVLELLHRLPADAFRGENIEQAAGSSMTDEQRNVALLALLEHGRIRKDERGFYRRVEDSPPDRQLSIEGILSRKRADYSRLDAMVDYCRSTRCHRAQLLRYFGEKLPPAYRCGNCSACGPASPTKKRRRRKSTQEAVANDSPSRPSNPADTLWQCQGRTYGKAELEAHKVERRVGLAILGLISEAEGELAPSGVANVLMGVPSCDAVKRRPALANSAFFGAANGLAYDDLVLDVFAMHAKDFLVAAGRRLILSDRGRQVLTSRN
jgi:ATP-dependent DNA helicase RecQ